MLNPISIPIFIGDADLIIYNDRRPIMYSYSYEAERDNEDIYGDFKLKRTL